MSGGVENSQTSIFLHRLVCGNPVIKKFLVRSICTHFATFQLIYFECNGTGTDGTFTGTDDTGMCFDVTGTGNEGTDSTSTDAYDIGTILSHFH